jgi:hypothetical protein
MKPIFSLLLLLSFATVVLPAEGPKDVTTAKIVAIKQYDQGRLAYWDRNVPIYDGYPFFDITLALDGKQEVVRFESMTGYIPSRWKEGSEIKVRQGKGQMILYNGAEEVPASIVTSTLNDCVNDLRPTLIGPSPAVPCDTGASKQK